MQLATCNSRCCCLLPSLPAGKRMLRLRLGPWLRLRLQGVSFSCSLGCCRHCLTCNCICLWLCACVFVCVRLSSSGCACGMGVCVGVWVGVSASCSLGWLISMPQLLICVSGCCRYERCASDGTKSAKYIDIFNSNR